MSKINEVIRIHIISRLELKQALQLLTIWRVTDRHHRQSRIAEKHLSHSPTEKPRTGIIHRLKLQQGTRALTCWRAKNRHDQQATIVARHHSYSQTEEPRIGIISKLELQQSTTATHFLESQGQASSTG
jgi:hypothetical protein